jgi:hypothetical protein
MRIKSCYAGALWVIPAVFVAGGLTEAARADSVLIDGSCGNSYGQTVFSDYGSAVGGVYRPITSLLLCNATDTAGSGGNSATTIYNLAASGFGINLDLSRVGAQSAFASFGIDIYFTATNSTTSYSMRGSYAFTSPFASMQSYLVDLSGGSDGGAKGYQYVSQSDGMASQSHYSSGALSGLLLANHHYLWHSNASIQALWSAPGGASATGDLQLAFSDAADAPAADPVPLPGTAVGGGALLMGLGTLGGRGRRRA